MLFNVPQYIDVEDKVAGPLTARQLLWMIGMGAVLLVLWNIFDLGGFFVVGIPIILLFVALAFYRPYNQPLISFLGSALMFLVRPKVYVWSRPAKAAPERKIKETSKTAQTSEKKLTAEEIRRLAQIVDNTK